MNHVDGGSPKNDGEWSRQRIAAMRTALEAAIAAIDSLETAGFDRAAGALERVSDAAGQRKSGPPTTAGIAGMGEATDSSRGRRGHRPSFGQQSGVRSQARAQECRSARLLVLCSMQLSHLKWPGCAFRCGGKAKNVAEATVPDAARIHQRNSTARSESTTSEHCYYQPGCSNNHICRFGTLRGVHVSEGVFFQGADGKLQLMLTARFSRNAPLIPDQCRPCGPWGFQKHAK